MSGHPAIFISHASEDRKLGEELAKLLTLALGLRSEDVRCTGADGFRLSAGERITDRLREDLVGASVFVVLLSEHAMRSAYVMMECGARWGAEAPKHPVSLVPVFAPGTPPESIKGPLSELVAHRIERAPELQSCAEQIASLLGKRAQATIIASHADEIARIRPDDTPAVARRGPSHERTAVPEALPIGAQPDAEGTFFRVWATKPERVDVVLEPQGDEAPRIEGLAKDEDEYFSGHLKDVRAGHRYRYRLDGGEDLPDPASRYQPEDTLGWSQVVDPTEFEWTDSGWRGVRLEDLVLYEVHVGTATIEGTYDSLIAKLRPLRDLGVTALLLMSSVDFPGERNWGYDPVDLFAPSRVYGGPEALRRLVDAAHRYGLAIIFDVVFNHVDKSGEYLARFSPEYFSRIHTTEWGRALNYTATDGRPVQDFVLNNACYWARDFHVDGLRLDAIQAIKHTENPHIVAQIARGVRRLLPEGRSFLVIAEDENNDPALITPASLNGFGLDGVYADDFHHELHVALTGHSNWYYQDYEGTARAIARVMNTGWGFTGQHSKHRNRKVGFSADQARKLSPLHFIWNIQNHDQIGNRPLGDRLNALVNPSAYRTASALLLLSPYTPLLFMGQEWAASTPFLFFSDHEPEQARAQAEGRKNEMAVRFQAFAPADLPLPNDPNTFKRSKLRWEERADPKHGPILTLYADLIRLRQEHAALRHRERDSFVADAVAGHCVALRRQSRNGDTSLLVVANLRDRAQVDLATCGVTRAPSGRTWQPLLDTEASKYGGRGGARLHGSVLDIGATACTVLESTATNG